MKTKYGKKLEEKEKAIREAAYYNWINSGCVDGNELENWAKAEQEYKPKRNRKTKTHNITCGIGEIGDDMIYHYHSPHVVKTPCIIETESESTTMIGSSKAWVNPAPCQNDVIIDLSKKPTF
jgi:hypothetical protein